MNRSFRLRTQIYHGFQYILPKVFAWHKVASNEDKDEQHGRLAGGDLFSKMANIKKERPRIFFLSS